MRLGMTLVLMVPKLARSPVTSRRPSSAEAFVEGGAGDGGQHVDHGQRDARGLDEALLEVEHGVVVGVEADDHAAPDLDAQVLDAAHLVQQGAVLVRQVLDLLGLAQRVLVGGLDADEDLVDVGVDHELEQLARLRPGRSRLRWRT